jgi:hypothetical protein
MREYHTPAANDKNHHVKRALQILRKERELIQELPGDCYLVKEPESNKAVKVSPKGCHSPACKKLQRPCEHLWATEGAFAALAIQDFWRARSLHGIGHAYYMFRMFAEDIPKRYLPKVRSELAAAEKRVIGGLAL